MDNKELPSVADLSKALKERIKKYGGVTAVWERLDSRFKDNGTRRIEGKKMRSKGKITFEAFKKAYERLDKDLAKPDKMTFGISGNPLLLNNVFQTLGLNNGYGGLLEIEYKEPELIDRIIGIELSLKETVQKINSLADRIENMHRKSTRTEKVSKDFETILGRLYSIFKQNKDQSLQDPFYAMRKKEDINNLISDALKAVSENNFSKLNKTQKLFSSKLESASRLVNVVSLSISNLELEAERISLLLMVYDDYKEYIYRNKILLEYYKLKEGKFVGNDNFATLNIYITSPLYILLLFLQIAVLFLKKLGAESLNTDADAIAYISSISQNDSIKTYLLNQVKKIRNTVKMMLNFFIQYEIEDTPSVIYHEYAKLAAEIIYLFHDIFIKNKINDYQSLTGKIKSMKAISKMKNEYFIGIYSVLKSHLEKFDELLINMSDIAQATGGDVKNG